MSSMRSFAVSSLFHDRLRFARISFTLETARHSVSGKAGGQGIRLCSLSPRPSPIRERELLRENTDAE